MDDFRPKKYERGMWLSLLLSRAIVDLDLLEQGNNYNPQATRRVKDILQVHLDRTQNQGSLDYRLENSMRSALGFDVIPKIFGLKRGVSRYHLEDYQAYLQITLEQFDLLETSQDPVRIKFIKEFLIELSDSRISRLETPARFIAA
jgi:hypothetical protein